MHRTRGTQSSEAGPEGAQQPAEPPGPSILDLRNPPPQEAHLLPEVQAAPDRWTLLWRAKVWVALATAVAGAGVYAISNRITPSYQASSLVQVSAHPQTGISPQDIATASNELAAQLAQLTRTAPVVALAAQSLHQSPGGVGQHVVAAVLANQNLIQITAQDTTPKRTQARAAAMAAALQAYVSTQGASAAGTPAQANPQLAAIDAQLAAAQDDAAKAQAAAAGSYPGSVAIAVAAQKAGFVQQLQLQRNTVAMQAEAADATAKPTVRVLGDASAAVKVQPRPALYTAVALVITALLAGQVAVFAGSRRSLRHRARSSSGQ